MSETGNGHERWSEELAAYLLGGLGPDEMAAFERHAEGCERCRAEARWLMPAMQALPESVERVEAPPALRERVMTEVRADAAASRGGAAASDAESPGTTAGGLADGAGTAPLAGEEQKPSGNVGGGSGSGARRRWPAWIGRGEGRRGLRPAIGLAALLLVVAGVAGYVVGNDGASSPSGGATSTVVSGHAPGIVATMVREGRGGSLHLRNVKPLPDGKVLEAWVQRNGKVTSVPALFAPDREGRATTTVASMAGVETVMVTVEPAGGSPAPTSAPLVTMPIPG